MNDDDEVVLESGHVGAPDYWPEWHLGAELEPVLQWTMADMLISALQTGFARALVLPGEEFDQAVVPLFQAAKMSVLEGVFFRYQKMDGFWLLCISTKPLKRNTCACMFCSVRSQPPSAAFRREIMRSSCAHREFIHAMWNLHPTPQSFARWLVGNSFPCTPQFDSGVQAVAFQQTPLCRIEARCGEEKSLLAPPESLLGL